MWYSFSFFFRIVRRDFKNFYGNVRVSDIITGIRVFGFGKMLFVNNLY